MDGQPDRAVVYVVIDNTGKLHGVYETHHSAVLAAEAVDGDIHLCQVQP